MLAGVTACLFSSERTRVRPLAPETSLATPGNSCADRASHQSRPQADAGMQCRPPALYRQALSDPPEGTQPPLGNDGGPPSRCMPDQARLRPVVVWRGGWTVRRTRCDSDNARSLPVSVRPQSLSIQVTYTRFYLGGVVKSGCLVPQRTTGRQVLPREHPSKLSASPTHA